MNRKLFYLILTVITALVLVACGGTSAPPNSDPAPTTAPTDMPSPTATPEPPDATTVVQAYHAALEAKDLDGAAALLADDVTWRGTPYLTGKDRVIAYLQGDMEAGFTYEMTDMRETRGRVTYTWTAYNEGAFSVRGEDTITVENGLITAFESYVVMGTDQRPDIPVVSFTASDTAFAGPDEMTGGWTLVNLTNEGQEPHHIQFVRLDEGKTADDLKTALTADGENFPEWSEPFGGPNAPDPGGSTSAIVYLLAGNYALIDVIPNAEGIPHFQTGLMKALTVTEPSGVMPGEPLPNATITLNDFTFTIAGTFSAGEQTIRFVNAGTQVHEAVLVKLSEGKTADDYLNTPPGEIPPAISLGGITGIVPGDGQYIRVNLESGNYALFCFFPDPASHAPHFTMGMVHEFSVP